MVLTPRQEMFVEEYLVDRNATQAAIRAGYSEKTACEQGSRLLANVKVFGEIKRRQKDLQSKLGITHERVLREYARLAFFDPRKLFDEDGNPKHITDLDDDTAAALIGLDVAKEVDEDTEAITHTKKYKLANKLGALDSLGKHLGLFDGKGGQKQEDNNLLDAVAASAGEDIGTDDLPEIQ